MKRVFLDRYYGIITFGSICLFGPPVAAWILGEKVEKKLFGGSLLELGRKTVVDWLERQMQRERTAFPLDE